MPDLRRVVTAAVRGHPGLGRDDMTAWAVELWREPVHERRMAAVEVRRSAILCLLPGIRAGQPDLGRFERYALPMLAEKEFFIRKAIGWAAREASKRDPDWVAAWTAAHASGMSGVTFREAIRRLPPETADRLRAVRAAPPP